MGCGASSLPAAGQPQPFVPAPGGGPASKVLQRNSPPAAAQSNIDHAQSLRAELQSTSDAFLSGLSEQQQSIVSSSRAALKASGILDRIIKVGHWAEWYNIAAGANDWDQDARC